MIQSIIGAMLLVLGLLMTFKNPVIGVPVAGVGFAMASATKRKDSEATTAAFFGLCLVCMVIVGMVAAYQVIF